MVVAEDMYNIALWIDVLTTNQHTNVDPIENNLFI